MKHGNYIINFIFCFFVAFGIVTFNSVSASAFSVDSTGYDEHCNTILSQYSKLVTSAEGSDNWNMITFKMTGNYTFYHSGKKITGDGSRYYTIISNKPFKYKDGVLYGYDNVCTYIITTCNSYVESYTFNNTDLPNTSGSFASISLSQPNAIISVVAYNLPFGFTSDSDSFDYELPIEIDVNDVNTYPIGHIEIVTPPNGSDVYLNYDNKRIGYYVNDITVKGKIPFAVEDGVTLDYETVHDKMLGCLSFPNGSITDGSGYTDIYDPYTYDDLPYWDTNLKLYGNYLDWVKNGYITFQFSFDLLVDVPGVTTFEQWSYKLPIKYSKFLFMTDFETKDYVISSYSFNIKVYTDLNGDGVDDDTGENIPGDYLKPPADDSWESKSWVEKLEYILTSIPSFIGSIFDSIISTLTHITSLVNSVISQGGTIGSLVSDLFNFFPDPIPQMITLTLGVMIFITFLSWVKK